MPLLIVKVVVSCCWSCPCDDRIDVGKGSILLFRGQLHWEPRRFVGSTPRGRVGAVGSRKWELQSQPVQYAMIFIKRVCL